VSTKVRRIIRRSGIGPVSTGARGIVRRSAVSRGRHRLLELRPRRGQHAGRAAGRYREHGRQVRNADGVAVDEVEDLPVTAGECVKRCPDPAAADGDTIGPPELGASLLGNVVISGVDEGEGFGELPGWPGRQRGSAGPGSGLIAGQAFPAPECEQPGPHPAGILQASRQRVAGDEGDLSGACSPRPIAKKTAAIIEQMAGMLVKHLGEGVPAAYFRPLIHRAQRRNTLSLTCHRTPPMRPCLSRAQPVLLRLSRRRLKIQFKQGLLDGSGYNTPLPVFAISQARALTGAK
jgi:hypothetical protein